MPLPPPLYYFCAWTDSGCLCGCDHFHLTLASAVACTVYLAVKRFWHRIWQALAHAGTSLRNKLGPGGPPPDRFRPLAIEIIELMNKCRISLRDAFNEPNSVMLTAIEATQGRRKADEFDLLVARLVAKVQRFSEERVQ